jgi:Zn-dependent protease/Tfp pilus assembly protein PilF
MIEVTLFVCIGWIVSICFHEFGHAIVAYWGGDTSVKEKGYLSLNPFKYIEPGYSLVFPLLFLMMGGIGLPGAAVYINQQNLRSRWWQSAVAAAGPSASILTVVVMAGIFRISSNSHILWLQPALAFLILIQVWGILINLLPIPSIDGFGIIEPFLSRNVRSRLQPLYRYGFIVLILLLFVPSFSHLLGKAVITITHQVLGVPIAVSLLGQILFKKWSLPLLLVLIAILAIGHKFTKTPAQNSIEQSEKLIKQKRYAAAVAILDQDLDQNPQHFDAWWQKGTALCNLHRYDEALDCYQSALAINPSVASLWQNSALLLSVMNQPQQAIDMYNRALELEPDDVQLWVNKASLWAEMGNFPKALATIDRAIEVDPRCMDAWYERACYQAQLGDHDRALISLQQAIQLNPAVRQTARTDPNFINLRHSLVFHQLTADR